MTSLVSRIVLL